MTEEKIKTKDKLAKALTEANAPAEMIERAKAGYYDDFETTIADPIRQLILDSRAAGLWDIADRAVAGEFDATTEEGEEWLRNKSPFKDLIAKGIDPFKED